MITEIIKNTKKIIKITGKSVINIPRYAVLLIMRMLSPATRAQIFDEFEDNMISVINAGDKQIKFYTLSSNLLGRAKSVLTKEVDTINWIDSFHKEEIFWDIGANVGVYSVYAAVCRSVRVLAFEPAAANFYVLSRNIQINALSDRVTAYCLAFTDTTKTGVLNLSSAALGVAINQFGKTGDMSRYWDRQAGSVTHGMLGFSIDDFITRFSPAFPNHIKIDVDGLEPQILAGAVQTLRDPRLRSIMLELCLTRNEEIFAVCKLLESCGFNLEAIGEVQEGGGHQGANHLFRRRI